MLYFVSHSQRRFIIKEEVSGIKPRQQAIQGVKALHNAGINNKKLKQLAKEKSKLFTLLTESFENRDKGRDNFVPGEKFIEIIITIIIEYSKSLKE